MAGYSRFYASSNQGRSVVSVNSNAGGFPQGGNMVAKQTVRPYDWNQARPGVALIMDPNQRTSLINLDYGTCVEQVLLNPEAMSIAPIIDVLRSDKGQVMVDFTSNPAYPLLGGLVLLLEGGKAYRMDYERSTVPLLYTNPSKDGRVRFVRGAMVGAFSIVGATPGLRYNREMVTINEMGQEEQGLVSLPVFHDPYKGKELIGKHLVGLIHWSAFVMPSGSIAKDLVYPIWGWSGAEMDVRRERAVKNAARRIGCDPAVTEAKYGRILQRDANAFFLSLGTCDDRSPYKCRAIQLSECTKVEEPVVPAAPAVQAKPKAKKAKKAKKADAAPVAGDDDDDDCDTIRR